MFFFSTSTARGLGNGRGVSGVRHLLPRFPKQRYALKHIFWKQTRQKSIMKLCAKNSEGYHYITKQVHKTFGEHINGIQKAELCKVRIKIYIWFFLCFGMKDFHCNFLVQNIHGDILFSELYCSFQIAIPYKNTKMCLICHSIETLLDLT